MEENNLEQLQNQVQEPTESVQMDVEKDDFDSYGFYPDFSF